MEFKKLQILPISPRKVEEERANRLWTKYKIALEGKEASAITCVGFLPVSPFDAFVGSATKLQLYDVDQQVVRKKFSMFKEVVRSCAIRSDGRLMCVGDEKGRIRVLEVLNKTVLRRLKGHGSAVHACEFSPNKTHVMSGGNDSVSCLLHLLGPFFLTLMCHVYKSCESNHACVGSVFSWCSVS
eukprot:GHVQ01024398.1.p1 GENE.GHVQ01024398.1~~GHVQ01024398.1.p1  ORF type:complete len:184 (+),score=20.89 GHVQ01024398.1:124-675(+)